jgi:hypothetical protein
MDPGAQRFAEQVRPVDKQTKVQVIEESDTVRLLDRAFVLATFARPARASHAGGPRSSAGGGWRSPEFDWDPSGL